MVELELDRLGTFVVTQRHRREEFSVTPYGCLYNPRIARHLSLRFPKKALDTTVNYVIRVLRPDTPWSLWATDLYSYGW